MLRPTISCDEALRDLGAFDAIIDVRSPAEFALDHMPGAINLPVLDDAERERIGTQHKVESAFAAKRSGAALVARNIAHHLEHGLAGKPRNWRPLLYCWRGGQRSGAFAHVLSSIGWPARQLEGGYRAYRRSVVAELERLPAQLRLRVICGATGSGKSRLLRHLARQGAQVIDLEELAQHRGSVLGALPQAPQPSQKLFETRLWWHMRALDPRHVVFVESESRKVGQLRVPDALMAQMRAADCVRLQLPLAARVRLLRDEYAHFEAAPQSLQQQLDCLAPLHGRVRVEAWQALARERRWAEMVERLLLEHYDPAYERSIGRNFSRAAEATDIALAGDDEAEFARAARQLAD